MTHKWNSVYSDLPEGFSSFSHKLNLAYNPHTGELLYFSKRRNGYIHLTTQFNYSRGYRMVSFPRHNTKVHNIIGQHFLNNGQPLTKDQVVVHIEAPNCTDYQDRLSNLKIISIHELHCRDDAASLHGTSYAKTKNKWIASISIAGKTKHLGSFKTQIEAGLAYINALEANGIDSTFAKEKLKIFSQNPS